MKRMRWLAVVTAGFVFLAAGCAEPAVLPESSEASAAPQDLSLGRYAGIEISAPVLKPVTDETVEQALSAIQRISIHAPRAGSDSKHVHFSI